MSRRTTNINEKITRTREKHKERENKTQRRNTAGNETKGSPADVAESMISRSEDYVSPAREAESIVRRPKMHHFHHNNEALEKTIKNKPFPPLATDAEARRTLGNVYLCMVSEGDRSHPVPAAVKKEPPSATHGSLVVIEHGRTRKTAVRCDDLTLESRPGSHV